MAMRRTFLLGVVASALVSVTAAAAFASDEPLTVSPSVLAPLSADAIASPMALATFQGRTVALVADEDDAALHVFDVGDAGVPREVTTTKLAGKPGHVAVASDGRVFVAIREKGIVSVFEPRADRKSLLLVERASIPTGGEPIGIAISADANKLLVASGWSGEVLVHSLSAPYTQSQRFEVSREPRSIAVSAEGHAFVSHAVGGALSMLTYANDLKTFSLKELNVKAMVVPETLERPGTQGYGLTKHEGRIYVPETFVDPETPTTYYGDGTESFGIITIDAKTGTVIESSREIASGVSATPGGSNCYLPRAAAFDPYRRRILVGCAGSNDILDFDSLLAAPAQVLKRRIRTDDAPSAIAVDAVRRVAIAWSQMGRSISILPLDKSWSDSTARPTAVARASGRSTLDAQIAHGRRIFHSGDGRIAMDGRACATCHPDGRDDGIAWKTPDGPRQTAMLAGRVSDTSPYGWTRAKPTLKAYITDTIARLNGRGLADPDMQDLVLYVKSLEAPPRSPTIAVPANQAAVVARGRELFDSPGVGCGTCHSGKAGTDGVKHDIGSAVGSDKEKAFETPSLRFVGRTAPYFHDGRYGSLRDLLIAESGKMGHVAQLSESDRNALLSYLTSL